MVGLLKFCDMYLGIWTLVCMCDYTCILYVFCLGIGWDVGFIDGTTNGRLLQAHAGQDSLSAYPCSVLHAWTPKGLPVFIGRWKMQDWKTRARKEE